VSLIGLHKTECVRREGPRRTVEALALATPGWVHWFNQSRLHSSINYVPPTEWQVAYYRQITPDSSRCLPV
jgi:putative transposase